MALCSLTSRDELKCAGHVIHTLRKTLGAVLPLRENVMGRPSASAMRVVGGKGEEEKEENIGRWEYLEPMTSLHRLAGFSPSLAGAPDACGHTDLKHDELMM
jgi:hypothetical protein